MNRARTVSVTVQFDTRIPAVYLYLRDPKGFRSYRSKQVDDGVIVDFGKHGDVLGIELLGPQDLRAVLKKILPRTYGEILTQLKSRRRVLEEILSTAAA